ncbi:MAG TPA: hypothetical protein VFB78_18655 [Acidimicrobiales bacterium]|nr:hypothetical protein [Acidimicrobiales bacterium]
MTKTLLAIAITFQADARQNQGRVTVGTVSTGIYDLDELVDEVLGPIPIPLVVTTTTVPNPVGNTLTLAGTASFLGLTAQPVSILFTDIGTRTEPNVVFDLTMPLPDEWKFGTSFADAQAAPWSAIDLVLSDRAFVFSTYDHAPAAPPSLTLKTGLNFTATVGFGDGPYELVTRILNAAAAADATTDETPTSAAVVANIQRVEVTVPAEPPTPGGTYTGNDISLRGVLAWSTPLTFGPLQLDAIFVAASNIYTPSPPEPPDPYAHLDADGGGAPPDTATDPPPPLEDLDARYGFGGLSSVFGTPVLFETELLGDFSALRLTFSSPDPSSTITNIAQLLSLLGDGARDLIPANFQPLTSIGLVEAGVEFLIPPSGGISIASASADLAMTTAWDLPAIPMTVRTLTISLMTIFASTGPAWAAEVAGQLVFHGEAAQDYVFDVGFTFDAAGNWTVSGEFVGTLTMRLGDVNDVFLGGSVQLPPADTSRFLLSASFTNPGIIVANQPASLTFSTMVDAELDILGDNVFQIENGYLTVDVAYPVRAATTAATFAGTVRVAQIPFAVSASVNGQGIVFTGALASPAPLDLMTLIGRLLPAGTTLPSWAPQHVYIDALGWTLDTVSGHDEIKGALTAVWRLPVGGGQPLSLSLRADLNADKPPSGSRVYYGTVSGSLVIGATFTVTYKFGKGDQLLTGSWVAGGGPDLDWKAAADDLSIDTGPLEQLLAGLDLPDFGLKSLTLTVDVTKKDVTMVGVAAHGAGFIEARRDPVSGSWGFAAGASLDPSWLFESLGIQLDLPADLRFTTIAAAVSTFASTQYTFPAGFSVGGVASITEGFNFYAQLDAQTNSTVQAALAYAKSTDTRVQVWASIGKNTQQQWLAQFTASITGGLVISASVQIDRLYLTFGATTDSFYAGLGFILRVEVDSSQSLIFAGQGTVEVGEATGFIAALAMTAQVHDGNEVVATGWHNALGIEGLTIGALAFMIGISGVDALPSFGIYGELSYKSFSGMVLAYLDANDLDPTTNQTAFAGSVSPFNLADLVALFVSSSVVPSWLVDVLGRFEVEGIDLFDISGVSADDVARLDDGTMPATVAQAFAANGRPFSNEPATMPTVAPASAGHQWFVFDPKRIATYQLTLQPDRTTVHIALDAQFYIAPNGVQFTPTLVLPKGYGAQGQIKILGVEVYLYAAVKTGGLIPGIDITAQMSPIDLGFIKITAGSRPSAVSPGGPELSVATYSDQTNPDPAKRSPHFLLTGAISLFDIITAEGYVSLGTSGFAMKVMFNLGGVLEVAFVGVFDKNGDDIEFEIGAEFIVNFTSLSISSQEQDGTIIFPQTDWAPDDGIAIICAIDISDRIGNQQFRLALKFDFFGLDIGFDVELPASALAAIADAVKSLLEAGEWLLNFLLDKLGLPRWLALLLSGAIEFAEKALGEALKALGADIKLAVQVFKALYKTAEITYTILKDVFTGDLTGLMQTIDEVFGLNIAYAALGQRIGPAELPADADFDTIYEWLVKTAAPLAAQGKYPELYAAPAGWLTLVSGTYLAVLDFGLVFYDPSLYSLKITIAGLGWTIEITYHRLSDTLGVFTAEVPPPSGWLSQQFGPVGITFPTFSVSVYTNGDFKIDVGFPRGNDWSRTARLELGSLTGQGGFYVAKLSSATSDVFAGGVYNPIIAAGLAMRVSISESVDLGLLSGGMSATVMGIVQGAIGFTAPGSVGAEPAEGVVDFLRNPAAVALNGQFSISATIYGKVDFGIVSASVNLSVSAAVAVQIRTGEPIRIAFSARISVSVTVKIDAFLFTIRISFSFHADYRFSLSVPWPGTALVAPAGSLTPLALGPAVRHRLPGQGPRATAALGDTKVPLTLWFAPETTMAFDTTSPSTLGTPLIVAGLAIPYEAGEPDNPFNTLVRRLVSVALAEGTATWASTAGVDVDAVGTLRARLSLKGSLARRYECFAATDGADGSVVDWPWIRTWLQANFEVSISSPPPPAPNTTPGAVVFPMLPDLQLFVTGRVGTDPTKPFVDFASGGQPPSYATYVQAFLAAVASFNQGAAPETLAADDAADQSLAAYVIADYFQLLIQGAVATLERAMTDRGAVGMTVADLEATDFVELAGSVGLYFRNGLRIPVSEEPAPIDALYRLTGQAFAADVDAASQAYQLRLAPGPNGGWISAGASATLDKAALDALARLTVTPPFATPPVPAPYLESAPATWTLTPPTMWRSTPLRGIRDLPPPLIAQLAAAGAAGVAVELRERSADATVVDDVPVTLVANQAARFDIVVKEVASGGTGVTGVYQLVAFDQTQYALLDALVAQVGDAPASVTASVLYPAAAGGLADEGSTPSGTQFLRTNLTIEAAPPTAMAARVAAAAVPIDAALDDPLGVLQVVREYSITQASGYYLLFPGAGLPATIFDSQGQATITLLVQSATPLATPAVLQPWFGSIVFTGVSTDDAADVYYASATDIQTYSVAVEPGTLPLTMSRVNPAGKTGAQQQLDTLYNLVAFELTGTTAFWPSVPSLPTGPQSADNDDPSNPWTYVLTVPTARYSTQNPQPTIPPTPIAHVSPYAGVGETVAISFEARDAFGDALVPYTTQATYPVAYFDGLLSPQQWPGTATTFGFDGAASATVITLDAVQATLDGLSGDALTNAVAAIQTAVDQLAGPSVQLEVSTTLEAASGPPPLHVVTPDMYGPGASTVEQLAAGILAYLEARQAGTTPPPLPPAAAILLALDDPISTQAPTEIAVFFAISRTDHVDPTVARQHPASASVSISVAPVATAGAALLELATQFAAAFPNYHLATGVEGLSGSTLYAISHTLVDVTIPTPGDGPRYFAPKPLSNQLQSGSVVVDTFDPTGAPSTTTQTYSDVDLDQLGAYAFQTIDAFLGPAFAGPAARVNAAALQRVVAAREQVASGYAANQLTWLFPAQVPPRESVAATDLQSAIDVLANDMQDSLDAAYAIDAVVQLPVEWNKRDAGAGAGDVSIYGTLADYTPPTGGGGASFAPFGAQPVKVHLDATEEESDRPTGTLTFPFAPTVPPEGAFVTIRVALEVTHVEIGDSSVAGGARPAWYRFVNPIQVMIGSVPSGMPVPIVLRRFPTPPTLVSQVASADAAGADLTAMLVWAYGFQMQAEFAPQDAVYAAITYVDTAAPATGFSRGRQQPSPPLSLADSLALFRVGYEQIAPYIAQLPTTPPDAPAANAVNAAVTYLAGLAETIAYNATWARAGGSMSAASTPTTTETYSVQVTPGDGHETVTVCTTATDNPSPLMEHLTITPLKLDGTPCDGIVRHPYVPGTACISVDYTPDALGGWRRYDIERGGLFVTQWQGGTSAVVVTRNEMLMSMQTAPGFQYRTSPAQFPLAVSPYLQNADTTLDVVAVTGLSQASLAEYLVALLDAIFASAPVASVFDCTLSASYGFFVFADSAVLTPIGLAPSVSLAPGSTRGVTTASVAAALSGQCLAWFGGRPSWPEGAFLSFAMSMLNPDHAIVLTLPAMQLPLANVTDLPT